MVVLVAVMAVVQAVVLVLVIPHLPLHLKVLAVARGIPITLVLAAVVEIQAQQAGMLVLQTVVMVAQDITEAEPVG
jgi:hypothetical protein|tara:strand:+ start:520 stop:747 length:228 start_codon:yes stop_codon:yes gene_type:complete